MSLTPISYLLIGLVLAAGVVGQWAAGDWTDLWRYPAALLVFLALIEGLEARRRSLVVEQRIGARAPLGEPVQLETRVENPGTRPLRLQSEPRFPPEVVAKVRLMRWEVAPGETARKSEPITLTELGSHGLGRLHLRILGRWGLAWWSRPPVSSPTLEGIPRRLKYRETGIGTASGGDKPLPRVGASGLELLAMREYRPGDPPRGIDWKASARAGKPIIRLYAEERRMDLVLVLDAGRGSRLHVGPLTYLGHYINVAARLAEIAVAQGDRVALVSFAGERLGTVPLVAGTAGLKSIRHQLGQLRSASKEYNPLAAVLYLRRILSHRSLVVFLTEIADAEAAGQLVDAVRLLVPKHSPLIASILDESIEAMRTEGSQHWLDPYRHLAAMEYGQARDAIALRLRRLGAEVVVAPPSRLDPAVLNRYQQLRQRRRV
jgi:uncharacterized protein (DUF58 family)